MKKQELTYEQAQKRLEAIMQELEANNQNIDKLCDLLKEAKQLYDYCTSKLYSIETEVKKILEPEE